MNKAEFQIYVASLTDYNNGVLHGEWIKLDGHDSDTLKEAVGTMLSKSPTAARLNALAEEYAIHDSEFGGIDIGEYESFHRIIDIYERLPDDEDDLKVCLAYCDYMGQSNLNHALDLWEDAYYGRYDSKREFAEEYVDEFISDLPDWLACHINYDSLAESLFVSEYHFNDGFVFMDV